uniref:Uncharacterized protein n=1 Tax=Rhizophora mucronata TaxID=61149 RepID=A0A2P2PK90_RHIMU
MKSKGPNLSILEGGLGIFTTKRDAT